jgi:predicted HicB family RNase H-like nuclease
MNSLFKKFQDVVEMGQEQDSSSQILAHDIHADVTSSSDPVVLRKHIATLTQQLARQVQAYEELREESTGIEKELTRLRLRFAASRELWDMANEQLEVVIQNLLEHQLFGNTTTTASSCGARADTPSNLLDATYVASLQEQIQRLKEMVQRSGEERSQLRSEKQYEQTHFLMRSSGLANAAVDTEVRQALEKMMLHWQEERTQYETTIESLEKHVARHAEREVLLSDQIKQEKELHQSTAATAAQLKMEVQELRVVQVELEEWRSGARTLPNGNNTVAFTAPAVISLPVKPSAEDTTPADGVAEEPDSIQAAETLASLVGACGSGAGSPEGAVTNVPTPLPLKSSVDGAAGGHASTSGIGVHAFQAQQAELEMLRQDYVAREEALDSLYADNKNLQEALQRAEAQARHADAELQDCRHSLEEVMKQLAHEQQKTKRIEEERHKAAAVEAKLRGQVRELQQALTAAAAAAAAAAVDHGVVAPPSSGGFISVPQTRRVRVGQPAQHDFVEQAVTYEDGGTWREWAMDAARWWNELKGDAAPHRAPLMSSGLSGRSALAPRRGPRVLLLFAGLIGVIMIVFLLLVIMESMYEAFKIPDGPILIGARHPKR